MNISQQLAAPLKFARSASKYITPIGNALHKFYSLSNRSRHIGTVKQLKMQDYFDFVQFAFSLLSKIVDAIMFLVRLANANSVFGAQPLANL